MIALATCDSRCQQISKGKPAPRRHAPADAQLRSTAAAVEAIGIAKPEAGAASLSRYIQVHLDDEGCITVSFPGNGSIDMNMINGIADELIQLQSQTSQIIALNFSGIDSIGGIAASALAGRLKRDSCISKFTISGANPEVAEMLKSEGFVVS
jgi:anti-anti-sigma regulatory factor